MPKTSIYGITHMKTLKYGKYNSAYRGEGFTSCIKVDGKWKDSPARIKWDSLFKRVYDENFHIKQPTYKDCVVCEEWFDFQIFAKWFEETCPNHSFELDKDVLLSGNKLYSPDTVLWLPQEINSFFQQGMKNKILPCGVHKHGNKYRAECSSGKSRYRSISVSTITEAKELYEAYRSKRILELAEQYRTQISMQAFESLIAHGDINCE